MRIEANKLLMQREPHLSKS